MHHIGRMGRAAIGALITALLAIMAIGGVARAQTPVTSQIDAVGAPYHITWDGHSGSLVRAALGVQPESRRPLTFLHTDPGPQGYAKYLAWFLARDADSFAIVWGYLNDSGDDFYCWLYSYPSNQLVSIRFVGHYTFAPSNEPVEPTPFLQFPTAVPPHYAGPDFTFLDWTRRAGALDKLDLRSIVRSNPNVENMSTGQPAVSSGAPARTLTKLSVNPLQEVRVEGGNGWREEGWRELHCLAYDSANNPYYLILYSNTTRGYVIDLKQAETYVADFGQTVKFKSDEYVFGEREDRVTGPPELLIRRFARQELGLTASHAYDNPGTGVLLEADFQSPEGNTVTVPGFWDGGTVWKLRFAPTVVGKWTWSTRSNDAGLNRQKGKFTCIAGNDGDRGFLTASASGRHYFAYADNSPFLPVMVAYSFDRSPVSGVSAMAGAAGTSVDLDPAFKQTVDSLTTLGFNRFVDCYLIDVSQIRQKIQHNEGGAPFINYDPDRLNPAYFQALDRRLTYCNSKGVVPDLGIGMLSSDLFDLLSDDQMRRLWRYVLARYATYDVSWNLFGRDIGSSLPDGSDLKVEALAELTRRYDPLDHPLTSVLPGSAVRPAFDLSAMSGDFGDGEDTPFDPSLFAPRRQGATGASSGRSSDASSAVGGTSTQRRQRSAGSASTSGSSGRSSANAGRGNSTRQRSSASDASTAGAPPDAAQFFRRRRQGGNGGFPGGGAPFDPSAFMQRRSAGGPGFFGMNASPDAGVAEYITSPAGQPLWPDESKLLAQRAATARVERTTTPGADKSWLDVITLNGGTLEAITSDYRFGKPVVIADLSTPPDSDAIRRRLWETRMRGGYWVWAGSASKKDTSSQASPQAMALNWASQSGQFFRTTRFWRLAPHNDLLRPAPVTSATAMTAVLPAAPQAATTEPPAATVPAGGPANASSAIFMLADPAWEYVVYFEHGGDVTLDLLEATGSIEVVWFNPRTGKWSSPDKTIGGGIRTFHAPDENDWVLHLSRR